MRRAVLTLLAALTLTVGLAVPAHADTYLGNVRCAAHYHRLPAGAYIYRHGTYHRAYVSAVLTYKRWRLDKYVLDGGHTRYGPTATYTYRGRHTVTVWWKDPVIWGRDYHTHCNLHV